MEERPRSALASSDRRTVRAETSVPCGVTLVRVVDQQSGPPRRSTTRLHPHVASTHEKLATACGERRRRRHEATTQRCFFLESASLAAAAVLAARRTAAAAAAPNLTPKRTMETRDEPDLGSNARKKTAAAPTRRPPHLYKQQTWSRRTRALNTVRAPATRRPMRFRGQFRQAPRCEPYTTTKSSSNVC